MKNTYKLVWALPILFFASCEKEMVTEPESAIVAIQTNASTNLLDSCMSCDGKITQLEFQYNGLDEAAVQIIQKKDNDIVFDGTVLPGGKIEINGTDKKGSLGTEIIIKVNGEEHTRIHTSCSVPLGPGMISGDFEVVRGSSRNGGELCPVATTPTDTTADENENCSDCYGKINYLELKYTGDTSSEITIVQKKNEIIVFEGTLSQGDIFEIYGEDKKSTLGTEIIIYVDGTEHTRIHTSCSVEIGPGYVSGDFLVLSGKSRNGGDLCPLDGYVPDDPSTDRETPPPGSGGPV